jgi:hypothetical protein
MSSRVKNTLAVIELALFALAIWFAKKAGLIAANEQRELLIGGGIGLIIGLGFLLARRRAVNLQRTDNIGLRVASISQYFALFLLTVYVIGASIALATGDFPASSSMVIAPFAFLAFAFAAARAHVLLYRERIEFQKIAAPSESQTQQFQIRNRKLTRIAKGLAIVQFLFLMEAGVICHFNQRAETSQKAEKLVTLQTEISSLQRDVKAKSQSPAVLKHRLDLVQQELNSI